MPKIIGWYKQEVEFDDVAKTSDVPSVTVAWSWCYVLAKLLNGATQTQYCCPNTINETDN